MTATRPGAQIVAELVVMVLLAALLLLFGCAEKMRPQANASLLAGGVPMGTAAADADSQRADEREEVDGRAVAAVTPQPPITLFGEFPDREAVPFESRQIYSVLQHTHSGEGADYDPAIDRTGRYLVFASTRHTQTPDLYVKQIDSPAVTQLTSDPASDIQPAFSPDGRFVAFSSDRRGNFDIWMIGVDGQGATQLTDASAPEVHPTWSPDGQRLAYCRRNDQSGQWELWMLDLNKPGLRKFLGYGLYPEWSPTEDVIVYQRARQRGSRWFSIWTLTLVNGEPRYPTEIASSVTEAYILPSFSPDGHHVAFCAVVSPADSTVSAPRRSDLWVIGSDGSEPMRLTQGPGQAFSPAWGPDGRLFYSSNRAGNESIWSVRPITEIVTTQPSPATPAEHQTAYLHGGQRR